MKNGNEFKKHIQHGNKGKSDKTAVTLQLKEE